MVEKLKYCMCIKMKMVAFRAFQKQKMTSSLCSCAYFVKCTFIVKPVHYKIRTLFDEASFGQDFNVASLIHLL